jgi:predicted nucleic-acid-binding protein
MSSANTDTMREQIEYLENFDEKDIKNVDIKEKLYEMWSKNKTGLKKATSGHLKALKNKTIDDFDVFNKGIRRNESVPERMSGKDPYGWGETGTKAISQIDDRLNALSQFIKEFKTIGKDLQDLQKRAALLEKSKPTLMSYAKGNMEEEMVSEVIEYVNDANRIMTESADAIRDAIKIQISENKKKTDKSSDDSTKSNRVDVKDLMDDKVDFDDFMSNPNSQMVFK